MESILIDWQSEVPDPGLVDFIPGFQENRKKEIALVKNFLKEKDFEALRKLAHNWKGFSRPYGYQTLEALGRALEKAAQNQDLDTCENLFSQFLHYINEKEVRLKSEGLL